MVSTCLYKPTQIMIKKQSFTLFEVLISLVILGIVVSSISKIYTKNDTTKIYYQLQDMENEFVTTNKVTSTPDIKIKSY
ncbi:MAG: prepilin-type N-terminal cleavage/methylation domain-containing protein [Campylobacterota bacterium]|nr:prepilin-type N-terminal cleavage/methylation domain-containing protein [Campylobacterota bacterium]